MPPDNERISLSPGALGPVKVTKDSAKGTIPCPSDQANAARRPPSMHHRGHGTASESRPRTPSPSAPEGMPTQAGASRRAALRRHGRARRRDQRFSTHSRRFAAIRPHARSPRRHPANGFTMGPSSPYEGSQHAPIVPAASRSSPHRPCEGSQPGLGCVGARQLAGSHRPFEGSQPELDLRLRVPPSGRSHRPCEGSRLGTVPFCDSRACPHRLACQVGGRGRR